MKSSFRYLFLVTFIGSQGILLVQAQGQNLITNGSFENFTIGAGGVHVIDDWVVDISGGGPFGTISGIDTRGATDGTNAAVFNAGDSLGHNNTLSQTFTTSPGFIYQLDFDYGTFGFAEVAKVEVEVTGNAQVLAKQLIQDTGSNPTVFDPYTFTFTADSASSTIIFTDVTTSAPSADGTLDNVSVTVSPTNVVPTLTEWGMIILILGLAGLAYLRVRKMNFATATAA